jgi:hypothetical protein
VWVDPIRARPWLTGNVSVDRKGGRRHQRHS